MTKKPKDSRQAGKQVSRQDESRWQRPKSGDRFPTLPEEALPSQSRRRRRAPSQAKADASDRTRNLISLFFLLATFGVLGYFVLIWQNPYSPLNPLAPPTPLPLMITATYTPAPTATAAPTDAPTATYTPSEIPTIEATMTFTPVALEGATIPPSTLLAPGDSANYRFALQNDRVIFLTNPDARGGCNWSSIAGSVMGFDGSALNGYGVHVVGNGVDMTVGTGSAPGFGPGGFEVPLGSAARDAQYAAQLVDPQGVAVSPVYTVDTNSDCEFNIAALRFVETEPLS
jgi:hypothetical protein